MPLTPVRLVAGARNTSAGRIGVIGTKDLMDVWIESHQALGRHPKLFRFSSILRIHKAQAVGHLQYLWWWSLDYAPTGDTSVFTSAEISAGAEWPGEPGPFHDALKECGWIDPDGMIHDWFEYAGKLLAIREKDRLRKRADRAPPDIPKDVQRTSNGNPADGARTGPDRTGPDITEEKQAALACAEPPQKPADSPPPEVVLTFPCRGKAKTWALVEPKLREYRETFEHLDVLGECKLALQWLRDHAANQKTATGMPAFLSRWMTKAVNDSRGPSRNGERQNFEERLRAKINREQVCNEPR